MGRHARSSQRWVPSDRGLVAIQVWQNNVMIMLAAAALAVGLIALGSSATSGPSITQNPLAATAAAQRLFMSLGHAAAVAARQLDEEFEQLGRWEARAFICLP